MKQFPILLISCKGRSIQYNARCDIREMYTFWSNGRICAGSSLLKSESASAVITLLTVIFSGSAFARIDNSARFSDSESPYAVISE